MVLDGGRLYAVLGRQRVALKSLGSGAFVLTGPPGLRFSFEEPSNRPVQMKLPAGQVLVRMDPFTPSAAQLSEFAGTYRSDEMDAVFRVSVKDGQLWLARTKLRPAAIDPMFKDSFRSQTGVIQFSRDAAGRVSGFLLEGGRVRHVKFWKDTSARGSSTVAPQ